MFYGCGDGTSGRWSFPWGPVEVPQGAAIQDEVLLYLCVGAALDGADELFEGVPVPDRGETPLRGVRAQCEVPAYLHQLPR